MKNFQMGIRYEEVLITSENNVLTPSVFNKLRTINDEIKTMTATGEYAPNVTVDDLCLK
jgi:hypothetical protein